jgi:maltooligosyltrehalose trehalohydrolase
MHPDYPQSLGATYSHTCGTTFTVWAPERRSVDLVLEHEDGAFSSVRRLARGDQGCWSGTFRDVHPGALYRYRLDGAVDQTFPDPASRFQPHGVHGPSQVVDPRAFEWTDHSWRTPALERLTIYELHTGTFTADGTFAGIVDRLPYLARLGVTAIEIMPLGDFPGEYNWGYDGVALFAPARCYGTPDALRALVDAAHHHRLAVILDVVYNHFGPDGAYATAFSPYYFSDRHKSPWGAGINFDGPHSEQVRRFFIDNAVQWVRDYHLDGLRLDATHAIVDDSSRHFLAELTSTVRQAAGRDVIVIAEDERHIARMMRPVEAGGHGLDAVWADDFHHQVRVHTAGDRDGYFAKFTGTTRDIAQTLRQGWFSGEESSSLSPAQFVLCIQNHDQVGNRIDGARLHHEIGLAEYQALSVLLLMAPQTPLLFMGQEWAATSPFLFFTDHHEELGRKVSEGRRAEFASFEAFAANDEDVPDPQATDTFHRSVLNWDEREGSPHAEVHGLYQQLLRLRQSHPALAANDRSLFDVEAVDGHTVSLRRSSRDGHAALLAVVRLSGSGETRVPVDAGFTRVLVTTGQAAVVGAELRFDGPAAIVLSRDSDRR